jgi:hypothetical protein
MARYEGMDQIVGHLQLQLAVGAPPLERSEPDMSIPSAPGGADEGHAHAVERIMYLLREAQELRTILSAAQSRALTQAESDDLLGLLGQVLQELWSCESVLHRSTPSDARS